MARTNVADVLDGIDTVLADAKVNAWIGEANADVTDWLGDQGLTAARLEIIERRLARYYVTIHDPRIRSGSIDDSSEVYQRDPQVSEYLDMAIAADPTGILRGKLLDQEKSVPMLFRSGVYDPGLGG